jgi:predicted tellurium resistance membrane protein TerC
MTDIIASDAVMALIQVVMINLVLSGDNAVVIGLAAAGLPADQRYVACEMIYRGAYELKSAIN